MCSYKKGDSSTSNFWTNSKSIAVLNTLANSQAGKKMINNIVNKFSNKPAPKKRGRPRKNTQPQTVRPRKVKYKTTGYLTKAQKPYKKVKTSDFYAEKGSKILIERGGTQTDANALYIGTSTSPINQVYISVCRSIIKQLFTMVGHRIISFEELIPMDITNQYELGYSYYVATSNTIQTTPASQAIPNTSTYNALATNLFTNIVGTFTANSSHQFSQFFLKQSAVAGMTQPRLVAVVKAEDVKVYIDSYASLKVQNRTKSSTGADAQDEDGQNISNNPLRGKIYEGNYSGFTPRYRNPANLANWGNGFVADPSTGVIVKDADDSDPTQTNKPPNGTYFRNTTKTVNIIINPGQIKYHTLKHKFNMNLTVFFAKYSRHLVDNSLQDISYIGKSFMFGLEKTLDSRDSDSDISVGWELTHSIKSAIVVKPNTMSTTILSIN